MKYLIIAFIMLIFMTSCDIMKSITFVNKTKKELTLAIPPGTDTYFFNNMEGLNLFHFEAEGKNSKITLLKGFGKWGKSDAVDLLDMITIGNLYYGADSANVSMVNPDFIKANRKGIFGNKLKVILTLEIQHE